MRQYSSNGRHLYLHFFFKILVSKSEHLDPVKEITRDTITMKSWDALSLLTGAVKEMGIILIQLKSVTLNARGRSGRGVSGLFAMFTFFLNVCSVQFVDVHFFVCSVNLLILIVRSVKCPCLKMCKMSVSKNVSNLCLKA